MTIQEIIQDMEDELIENGCFHELDSYCENEIIFNYAHYWDGYPEFQDQIALETETLLGFSGQLKQAGFCGFLHVNDYVMRIN